jgi:endonuclease YncB( thermonuclease family)
MLFDIWRVVKKMNKRVLTMVAMLPAAFAGMFMAGGNKSADGQAGPAVIPLSVIQGPVEADVVKVTDGDTIQVAAYIWPDAVTIKDVRIRGIDTPEIRGRCQYEKDMAAAAKSFVVDLVNKNKKRVKLTVIGCNAAEGAGFGRCLANVTVGSVPIAGALIEKNLARTNNGEPRQSWCDASK